MMGLDPAPRGAIELPAYYKSSKDNKFLCKAHGNDGCKSCCKSPFHPSRDISNFLHMIPEADMLDSRIQETG